MRLMVGILNKSHLSTHFNCSFNVEVFSVRLISLEWTRMVKKKELVCRSNVFFFLFSSQQGEIEALRADL